MGQGIDALRHVNAQIDRLIEVIGSMSRGSTAAAVDPAMAQLPAHLVKLAAILDPNELYETIVRSAVDILQANRGFLTMLEEGSKLRFKAGFNFDQQVLASPAFAYGRGTIKQVLQGGQPLLLRPDQTGGTYALCVPLRFGKRLDGVERTGGAVLVELNTTTDESKLRTLQQLADQAAISLENAYIFQRGREGNTQILRLKDNISKLYDVGQSISTTMVLDDLLETIIDNVIDVSRAQRGFIMLVDEDQEESNFLGRHSRKRFIKRERFSFSSTVIRKAIEEKRSQIHKELPEADLSVSMVAMELKSILCVPLKEKDEVIGLVYVDSQESNKAFDDSDREIVESLCGQASVAVVNAKLYEDAKDAERLAHELDIASRIQMDLLPKKVPPINALELHGLLVPALEVGGDYFDFIPHEGTIDSMTIAIGDVSGKGVGAGLVMAMCRSALRSLVQHEGIPTTPLTIMRSLNLMMVRDIPRSMFMTLNIVIWDAPTRTAKYTSAGHEHLIIFRAKTGDVEVIKGGGIACGVVKEASASYKEQSIVLASGDQVVLYTDGVSEAMNEADEQFSLEATVELVRRGGRSDPKTLCEGILQRIDEFRGEADPHDDITLVAFRAP
ncbi:MAG: SpoIIE family protein phosphatase [Planctomycetes bacterium]|nr:SpoIIE family protein phosphatase [Planctomycetota bacterium]